jgi:RHS repeat-associated protein
MQNKLFDLSGRIAGADVVICSRHEDQLKLAAAGIAAGLGVRVEWNAADMADRRQADTLAQAALSRMGRVDILVNNAGSNTPQSIDGISDDTWDHIIELNLSNTYMWDSRNQLIAITSGITTSQFSYDGFGRRLSRSVNGTTTNYLYDGVVAIQESSGAGVTSLLNGSAIDEPVIRNDANGVKTVLTDENGTTLAVLNSSGATQSSYTYEPFGYTESGSTHSLQFSGRENDDTGLYYYRARYYSARYQRFISEDPIGSSGGDLNLYAYVGNSPLKYSDPFGLWGTDGRLITLRDNTIMCDGRGGISIFIRPVQDLSCGIGDCLRDHEMSHRKDALAANPKICVGAGGKPLTMFTQVFANGAAELRASELRAYTAEGACSNSLLDQHNCDDCTGPLNDRIRQVQAEINKLRPGTF